MHGSGHSQLIYTVARRSWLSRALVVRSPNVESIVVYNGREQAAMVRRDYQTFKLSTFIFMLFV